MRGDDDEQGSRFSDRSLEDRLPRDRPLRPMPAMVDRALREMGPRLAELYARTGRPSIPPERLLRALLLQILFSVRSERRLDGTHASPSLAADFDYDAASPPARRPAGARFSAAC